MPAKPDRDVHLNLKTGEAARQACTIGIVQMTGTVDCLVSNNRGFSADDELESMQSKCAKAAEFLGPHKMLYSFVFISSAMRQSCLQHRLLRRNSRNDFGQQVALLA